MPASLDLLAELLAQPHVNGIEVARYGTPTLVEVKISRSKPIHLIRGSGHTVNEALREAIYQADRFLDADFRTKALEALAL